ncbi:SIR2 family protein [Ralstonia pseudosolanacearum]
MGRRNLIADAYNFETFALELLRVHLKRQGKSFGVVPFRDGGFDTYLPDGFDDFHCPVYVECMVAPSKKKLMKAVQYFRRAIEVSYHSAGPVGRVVLLLLVDQSFGSEETLIAQPSFPGLEKLEVVVWSWSRLEELATMYPDDSKRILENLLPLRVRNAVKSSAEDWREEREARVRELADCFHNGPFSLFLGAGVSSSAGMPDWNNLLNALFISYINGNGERGAGSDELTLALVRRMQELDTPSALVSARYLRKGIAGNSEDGRSFTAAIRGALYGLRRKDRDPASRLIVSLAQLCMPRRTGAKVRGVVTYNFDDLFERELKRKSILHRVIYSQSQQPDVEELPVYHVHGFIPEHPDPYSELDDATLVFAEEGYHQMYTDAYHWSNLAQLHALRESTCLMVGLSMADPNLRRLLEIAQRGAGESRHYAFMKRVSAEKFMAAEADNVDDLFVDPGTARQFLQRHYALTETLMRELGVKVIWFEHFDEIPAMLSNVGLQQRG